MYNIYIYVYIYTYIYQAPSSSLWRPHLQFCFDQDRSWCATRWHSDRGLAPHIMSFQLASGIISELFAVHAFTALHGILLQAK